MAGLSNGLHYDAPQIDQTFCAEMFDRLTCREALAVKLRYGFPPFHPCTLAEAGELMTVSPERVRQLEIRAIEKMRKAVGFRPQASRPEVRLELKCPAVKFSARTYRLAVTADRYNRARWAGLPPKEALAWASKSAA